LPHDLIQTVCTFSEDYALAESRNDEEDQS
jgi:hypothetical protein